MDFVIQNQLLGKIRSKCRIAFMIFEDQLDLRATQTLHAAVFGYGHGQICHDTVCNFLRQFSTRTELASRGCCAPG